MSHRATGRHDAPRVNFRMGWFMPPREWMQLVDTIREVRAKAGQDAVVKFIADWRARGHIECTDADAKTLEDV